MEYSIFFIFLGIFIFFPNSKVEGNLLFNYYGRFYEKNWKFIFGNLFSFVMWITNVCFCRCV